MIFFELTTDKLPCHLLVEVLGMYASSEKCARGKEQTALKYPLIILENCRRLLSCFVARPTSNYQPPPYFTSCQFFPHPTSTFSGTDNFIAPTISSLMISASFSTTSAGVSNTNSSCTCSSIRLAIPSRRIRR